MSNFSSPATIKSEYRTSSQSMNCIPTTPSQSHGNHESSHACVNNASNYVQSMQFLHHSPQGPQCSRSHQIAQFLPSSQIFELSTLNQMSQLPYTPTARNPKSQPPHLEETSRPSEETPFYVNPKQFDRILKRRVTRQRLQERLAHTPGSRRPYIHESRHKHAKRRPRGDQEDQEANS